MKKFILALLITIIAQTSFAEDPDLFAAQQDERESLVISDSLKLSAKAEHDEDKQIPYSVEVSYPQFLGEDLSSAAKEFNKIISDMAHQEVDKFKKYIRSDMAHMKTLPEDLKHNTLSIDYDVDSVKPGKQTIISVRLSIEGFQAGRAHPYHSNRVLNFDLDSGKILTLNELFKSHSNYLKVIAAYARKKLNAKLQDKFMIDEGTKPVDKNFQNWNLESNGIVFTFNEYQVAPYTYGRQEVQIPFAELKKLISPKASIYPCLNNLKG